MDTSEDVLPSFRQWILPSSELFTEIIHKRNMNNVKCSTCKTITLTAGKFAALYRGGNCTGGGVVFEIRYFIQDNKV